MNRVKTKWLKFCVAVTIGGAVAVLLVWAASNLFNGAIAV